MSMGFDTRLLYITCMSVQIECSYRNYYVFFFFFFYDLSKYNIISYNNDNSIHNIFTYFFILKYNNNNVYTV